MKRKNLDALIDGDRTDAGWIDFGVKNPTGVERCYHTHPPLPLPNSDFVIYCGSCSRPIITDADIYIGLCHSMTQTERRFPWVTGTEEIYFPIPDMGAPKDIENFKALVEWTKSRLEFGFKVHVGCIGGHGRTGTFLAALVSLYGEKDAITYVRQHYCPKAVESKIQVQFLETHFAITPMRGYKDKHVPLRRETSPQAQEKNGLIPISPIESAMAIL